MFKIRRFFSKDKQPKSELDIMGIVQESIKNLSPADALRFLFRLDAQLYILHSQKAKEYEGGLHPKHRLMRYHDFFTQRIHYGEHVIDIGCGNGALTYDIAAISGATVLGIDLNEDHIAQAQTKHPHPKIQYILGNVLTDLPQQRFDVAVLSNVLEHLPERAEFLKRVKQVAQVKRFLIRVPVFQRDWRVPLKQELGVEWRLDLTHEIEYTQENFAAEVTEAGLEITHLEIRWGEIWAEIS